MSDPLALTASPALTPTAAPSAAGTIADALDAIKRSRPGAHPDTEPLGGSSRDQAIQDVASSIAGDPNAPSNTGMTGQSSDHWNSY
jgi:hypothetical protein